MKTTRSALQLVLPRFVGYYPCSGDNKWPLVEYWPGDDVWSATVHVNIPWRGRTHWFLFAMPDWLCS